MNKLNVFTYRYYSWRPRNWKNNIKQFFLNIKYAWHRATRGYCEWDTWNLNSYYLDHFVATLSYFRDHLHSVPPDLFDETAADGDEAWKNYLNETITHLINASLDRDKLNEFAEPFIENIELSHNTLRPRDEELNKKYWKKEKELHEWQKEELHKGLIMLSNRWYDLWD